MDWFDQVHTGWVWDRMGGKAMLEKIKSTSRLKHYFDIRSEYFKTLNL